MWERSADIPCQGACRALLLLLIRRAGLASADQHLSNQLSHRSRSQLSQRAAFQSAFSCRRVVVLSFDATSGLHGSVSSGGSQLSYFFRLLHSLVIRELCERYFGSQWALHCSWDWPFNCRLHLLPSAADVRPRNRTFANGWVTAYSLINVSRIPDVLVHLQISVG